MTPATARDDIIYFRALFIAISCTCEYVRYVIVNIVELCAFVATYGPASLFTSISPLPWDEMDAVTSRRMDKEEQRRVEALHRTDQKMHKQHIRSCGRHYIRPKCKHNRTVVQCWDIYSEMIYLKTLAIVWPGTKQGTTFNVIHIQCFNCLADSLIIIQPLNSSQGNIDDCDNTVVKKYNIQLHHISVSVASGRLTSCELGHIIKYALLHFCMEICSSIDKYPKYFQHFNNHKTPRVSRANTHIILTNCPPTTFRVAIHYSGCHIYV